MQKTLSTQILLFVVFVISNATLLPLLQAQKVEPFSDQQIEYFENKVRPLLTEHCLKCHGQEPAKVRGGLLLTSRNQMLEGGDSGPAIDGVDSEESLLMKAVRYEDFEMPPSGQLPDSDIAILAKWIEMGAPDPRNEAITVENKPIDLAEGRKFWAFQPRSKPPAPTVTNPSWAKSEIDQFILARLESKDMIPVATASRQTLLRRIYLTLIGLPPTVEQIEDFVNDSRSDDQAIAGLVDELLESPHFGERWGRHWLDVARFAESSGGGRSLMFTDAWRFRDYVIDSYNEDKPIDQFIKEQLAGDLLPFSNHDERSKNLIATGLLALGPTNYEQQDKELLRMEVVDEQIDTVGRAFLGLTLGCARCHDHKFDPIPTSDYYGLAGIFKSTKSLVDGNVSKYVEQSIATEAESAARAELKAEIADLSKRIATEKQSLVQLGGNIETNQTRGKTRSRDGLKGIVIDNRRAKLKGDWMISTSTAFFLEDDYQHDQDSGKGQKLAVYVPVFQRGGDYEVRMSYSAGSNRASNVPVTIDHQDGKTKVMVNQTLKPPINGLWISLGKFRFEADTVSTVTISTQDTDGHVIIDAIQFIPVNETPADNSPDGVVKSDVNPPDMPTVNKQKSDAIKKAELSIRKLEAQLVELKKVSSQPQRLAMSVMDAEKPSDGRIHIRGNVRMFGPVVSRRFVSVCSPPDFEPEIGDRQSGRLQLAEWIASPENPLTARVYVNRVWRHLFGRGLVETTDNFGAMGSRPTHPMLLDYLANDFVENGWSTKKLIRKIMLSRVYQLRTESNLTLDEQDDQNRWYGRASRRRLEAEVIRDSMLYVSGQLDLEPGGLTIRKLSEYDLGYQFKTVRRSVYVPAFRNSMLDLFEVFDFANPNLVSGNRNTSTLPTQALFMMNSPMVIEQSRHAAERLLKSELPGVEDRVIFAYRLTLGRVPTEMEIEASLNHIASFGGADRDAWSSLFHALFASLDFRYMN